MDPNPYATTTPEYTTIYTRSITAALLRDLESGQVLSARTSGSSYARYHAYRCYTNGWIHRFMLGNGIGAYIVHTGEVEGDVKTLFTNINSGTHTLDSIIGLIESRDFYAEAGADSIRYD